jgi:hypothetical protein
MSDSPTTKHPTFVSEDSRKINESMKSPKSCQSFTRKTVASHLEDIFQEPKKLQSSAAELEKRFIDYQAKANQRLEQLKKEKEEQEKAGCTFRPKTSMPTSDNLKFSHFLQHMDTVNENKKKNLERKHQELKEEEEKLKATLFKPTISKKTQKIVSKNKSTSDLHVKLFKESEELKKKKENESQAILNEICSFKPQVNKKSQQLKREGKIAQRLYEEASKKREKMKETPNLLKNEKLISEESKNIIKKKFLNEISEIVVGDSIAFNDFTQMLVKTGFLHQTDSGIKEEEKNLVERAWKTFEDNEESKSTHEKVKNFLLNLMILENDDKKIHREFQVLYENRKKRQVKAEDSPVLKGFSFTPRLNPVTKELSKTIKNKRMSKYSTAKPEKVLIIIEKEGQKKIEEKRDKSEQEDLKTCTFKPAMVARRKTKLNTVVENFSLSSECLKLLSDKKQRGSDQMNDSKKMRSQS